MSKPEIHKQQQQQQYQTDDQTQEERIISRAVKEAIKKELVPMIKKISNKLTKISESLQKFETNSVITDKVVDDIFQKPHLYPFTFMNGMTIGDLIRQKLFEKKMIAEEFCQQLNLSKEQYLSFLRDESLPEQKLTPLMTKLLGVTFSDFQVCRAHTYDLVETLNSSGQKEETANLTLNSKFYSILKKYCEEDKELIGILSRNYSYYLDEKSTPEEEIEKAMSIQKKGLDKPGIGYAVRSHLWKALRLALSKGDVGRVSDIAHTLKDFLAGVLEPNDEEIKEVEMISKKAKVSSEVVQKTCKEFKGIELEKS